ncbi:Transcription factor SOX-7 [Manis javanica]|nr:Transcription factor SOX-7 [Manis javanica]
MRERGGSAIKRRRKGEVSELRAGKAVDEKEKRKRGRVWGRGRAEEEKRRQTKCVCARGPGAGEGGRGRDERGRDSERGGGRAALGSREQRGGGGDEEVGARRGARAGRSAGSIPARSAAGAGAAPRRARSRATLGRSSSPSSRCPVAQEGDVALFEPCGWEQLPAMEKGIGMSTHDPSCIKTKPLQTHPQCLRLYAKPGEWRRTASVLGESWLCMRRFED